jgi:K+-transporting ATPase KdpF subunit
MNGGIGLIFLIIISAMLFIYLGYVLVNPEKF